MGLLIGGKPAGGGLQIGAAPAAAGTEVKAQQVAANTTPSTAEATKIDQLIARLGGIEAIEAAAAAMVQADTYSLKAKAEAKKAAALVKNLKSIANELEIKTEKVTLNGTKHCLTMELKVTSPTSIDDKEKLYHYLEAIRPGLYFHLSSVAIGDLKDHVPDAAYSKAGCSVGRSESLSVSAKVKGAS